MGVPAFYRWLVEKYPKVVVSCIEEKGEDVDITTPNPNGLEFDNLYLDMNGIIHPCFHPDDIMFPPTTYKEVFENIYAYVDRLFGIVRPRKLLYLAIDGVAPRAKMNQQRSRRFKNAKDNQIAEEEETKLRADFERKGKKVLPKVESEVSDSNVITPGTVFMYELSKTLRSYILGKLRNDPGWKDVKVILSDATVPGEGEHKVMSFIRSIRNLPDYDPNTRHCLYGLDADLIMLALATHELHFSILREDVRSAQGQTPDCQAAMLAGIEEAAKHLLAKSSGEEPKPFFDVHDKKRSFLNQPQYFNFVHLWILREYLELDMQIKEPPERFVFDIERIVDDFIFICFFVGNDFLPHMPTLAIHENAIDLLMYVYKKEFKNLGGYLVDMQRINDQHAGYVKLKRVEKFILCVGNYEENIFKKRAVRRERQLRKIVSQLSEIQDDELVHEGSQRTMPDVQSDQRGNVSEASEYCTTVNAQENNMVLEFKEKLENTKQLKEMLKECIRRKSDTFRDGNMGSDKVKLGSVGWKQRYYKEKFSAEDPRDVESTRKEIVQKYTEGLCWVLLYYFSGTPSWNWFYPYYYGPFASDLRGLASAKVKFEKGSPFRPFDQLMAVLPPRSAHALPKAYRKLMIDDSSIIIHFYPTDFEVDVDGKRFVWQGICKLPFIDEEQLLSATRDLDKELESTERDRNVETIDTLFMRRSNRLEGGICGFLKQDKANTQEFCSTEEDDSIICYHIEWPRERLHIPRVLEGVLYPMKIIFEFDIEETALWHEYMGRPPIRRFASQPSHRTQEADVGKAKTDETWVHKHAGTGWAGRGKDRSCSVSESHISVNQRNYNQFGYSQSSYSASRFRGSYQNPRPPVSYRSIIVSTSAPNVDRGMENLRLSSSDSNRSYGGTTHHTQNSSFRPSRGVDVSHQNPTWQPASRGEPRYSNVGSDQPSAQMNSGNVYRPPFTGRGRGRAQYRPNTNYGHSPDRW